MNGNIDLTENRVFRKSERNKVQFRGLIGNSNNKNVIIDSSKPINFFNSHSPSNKIVDKHFNKELNDMIKELDGTCHCCGEVLINQRKTLCDICDER